MAEKHWKSVTEAVTRLFDFKRYPELKTDLSALNEKVRLISNSEIGNFLGEYYHDKVMSQCMGKLRVEVVRAEQTGKTSMIDKLAEIWTHFYTSILPTLLAFFASVQPQQNKLSIRALTLISFRDYIILKLNLSDALRQYSQPHPPQIQQMLLVLQSVREATPTEEFFALQELVGQVVDNYFPMVTRAKTISERTSSDQGGGAGLEGRRAGTEDMPTSQAQKIFHRRGSSLGTVDKDQLAALEGK